MDIQRKVNKDRSILSRQRFFSITIFNEKVRECISGKNEDDAIKLLNACGYELHKDFVRQYPVGEKFVLDFAFVKEQIALEIDGKSHNDKQQKRMDRNRDSYLRSINWIPLRFNDSVFTKIDKLRFFKWLIKDVVEERREQWEIGTLYPIDYKNYNEEDYE